MTKYHLKIKNSIINLFIILFVIVLFYLCLFNYENLYNNIFISLDLWLYKVFPPLFIFYFISTLLISTKSINMILYLFKPLNKIMKFDTINGFNLFIISMFLGNPTTASLINDYYESNMITLKDSIVLSKCASFINPLFIFSIISNKSLSIIIYLSHVLTNIIIAIYSSNIYSSNIYSSDIYSSNIQNNNAINLTFFNQMNKFPHILLCIASFMILSYIVITIISLISINTNFTYLNYISLIVEVSYSTNYLKDNYIYLIPSIISFNGLCIHLQVNQHLKTIKYTTFFIYRLIASIISLIIYVILHFLINL